MAHEYVNLEEAASFLGLSVDEVKGLRESGDLRGFADKGSWKFRKDHLEEYQRSQSADSDPDIPIFDESGPGASDLFQVGGGEDDTDSDGTGRQAIPGMDLADEGDFDFGGTTEFAEPANTEPPKPKAAKPREEADDFFAEEFDPSAASGEPRFPDPLATADGTADLSEEAKAVGQGSTGKLQQPDLDVDPGDAEKKAAEADDDLGMNLVPGDDDAVPADLHTHDSGIILADTDSGVGTSDVLAPESGLDLVTDSDLLSGSDIDEAEAPVLSEEDSRVVIGAEAMSGTDFGDSDVSKMAGEDSDVSVEEEEDSGIALDIGDESGIALDIGDESGIALDAGDSGIALDFADDESGIELDAGDSGIALDVGGDSGIALDLAGDSGIALDAGDSGLALDFADSGVDEAGADGTQRVEIATDDAADDFADFDDASDESDATQRVPVGAPDSEFDLAEGADDEFESGDAFSAVDDDVADELEELDEFDDADFDDVEDEEYAGAAAEADADPFEDDDPFAGDESSDDWPEVKKKAPTGPQWGAVPLVGLTLCTVVMLASAMMTWQSMRVMWTGAVPTEQPTVFDNAVDQLTGLIP